MSKFINQAQASRLWAIAQTELKLQEREVRTVFAEFGVASTTNIQSSDYESVIERLYEYASSQF